MGVAGGHRRFGQLLDSTAMAVPSHCGRLGVSERGLGRLLQAFDQGLLRGPRGACKHGGEVLGGRERHVEPHDMPVSRSFHQRLASDRMETLGEALDLFGFCDVIKAEQERAFARPKRGRPLQSVLAPCVVVEVALLPRGGSTEVLQIALAPGGSGSLIRCGINLRNRQHGFPHTVYCFRSAVCDAKARLREIHRVNIHSIQQVFVLALKKRVSCGIEV